MVIRRQVMWLCFILILLLAGLSACTDRETKLPFEIVEQGEIYPTGQYYEALEPSLYVITEPSEVTILEPWYSDEIIMQLQQVDYDTYFVLALFQGYKPTDGYGIQVERIVKSETDITIDAQFREPLPDREQNDIVTSPYCLLQVQKKGAWEGVITFKVSVADDIVITKTLGIP